jgi:hypothetical protein
MRPSRQPHLFGKPAGMSISTYAEGRLVDRSDHRVKTQGTVHVRYRGVRWLVLGLGALLVLPACSADVGKQPVALTTPYAEVTPITVRSEERPSTPPADKPLPNDLKKGRVTRTLKAGAVRATVKYSLQNRVERWAPGVAQPLKVSMTAIQPSTTGYVAPGDRKIYLSRVTAYLDVSDTTGHLDSPNPLIDKADVNPGFLVTSPSSYSQVFVLPALPDEATTLTIDFRYEMLVLQPESSPRDFSKRTVTDTVVISRS